MIAPGIYPDLDEAAYRADPALGSTDVKNLLEAAKLYRWQRDHPDEFGSDAMRLGSALHALVLGGPHVEVIDPELDGADDTRDRGGIWVTDSEADDLVGMVRALDRHPTARRYLAPGQHECSAFAVIEDVPCKARFDVLHPGVVAVDLKRMRSVSRHAIRQAIRGYGYDVQAAHYRDVLTAQGGEHVHPLRHVLVCVTPKAPYLVRLAFIPEQWIEERRRDTRRAREIWRDCTEAGVWPDPDPDVIDDLEVYP